MSSFSFLDHYATNFISRLVSTEKNGIAISHFIPAIAFSLSLFYFLSIPLADYLKKLSAGQFYTTFMIIEGSAVLLNIFYWFKSYEIVQRYDVDAKHNLSYTQSQLVFIRIFLTALIDLSI